MQKRIFIWFVLIVVIPSGIIYFLANNFYFNYSVDKQMVTNSHLVDEMRKNLDTQLLHYQQLTMQFYLNEEAMDEILSPTPIFDCISIKNQLNSFVNSNRLISSAYLMTEKGSLYSGHGLLGLEEIALSYQDELLRQDGRIFWTKTYPMTTNFGLQDDYFFGMRHIRKDEQPIAILCLGFNSMFFADFFQYTPFEEYQSISVYQSEGYLIANNGEDSKGALDVSVLQSIRENPNRYLIEDDEKGDSLIVSSSSRLSDWVLTLSLSPDHISRELSFIQKIFYLSLILYFLFFFYISYLVSRKLGRPLKDLTEAIRQVGGGNLDIKVEENHIEEIRQLSMSFNSMTHRVQNLLDEVKSTEKAKRKAYLQNLQLQLTPHFLYNTLNTIRWMAQINGQENIVTTTKALITYLKKLTDIENEFIPLGEEISLIEAYTTIQRFRYKEFSLHYDIPEALYSIPIHKLMILNIVENSIIHGFSEKDGAGSITIKAFRDAADLVFQIQDNGIGMTGERLAWIRDRLHQKQSRTMIVQEQEEGHIGLRNIQDRLQLYHGDAYRVEVESVEGDGCTVSLRQPIGMLESQ